jgi:hypothetical protein
MTPEIKGPVSRVQSFEEELKKAIVADFAFGDDQHELYRGDFNKYHGLDSEKGRDVSPSTASQCLRWLAYSHLGYKPKVPTVEGILIMKSGSAFHHTIDRIVGRYYGGIGEFPVENEILGMKGKVDRVMFDKKINKYRVFEYKTTGDYPYKKLSKSPEEVYQSKAEARKQLLGYMYLLSLPPYNLDIAFGHVFTFNRASLEFKVSRIFWDERSRAEAKAFIDEIAKTREIVRRVKEYLKSSPDVRREENQKVEAMLPKPTVCEESTCKNMCPFGVYCTPKVEIVAKGIKPRRPTPTFEEKKIIEAQKKKRAEAIAKLDTKQAGLEGF